MNIQLHNTSIHTITNFSPYFLLTKISSPLLKNLPSTGDHRYTPALALMRARVSLAVHAETEGTHRCTRQVPRVHRVRGPPLKGGEEGERTRAALPPHYYKAHFIARVRGHTLTLASGGPEPASQRAAGEPAGSRCSLEIAGYLGA